MTAMRHLLFAILFAFSTCTVPVVAADNAQQQRMVDCNKQAAGMTGAARQKFMSSCLAGTHPNCTPGKSKPCGNSCIALDKTCHK
jgi:hypothetical protein